MAVVADRVAAWHRLGLTDVAARRVGFVLSTYPGRPDQIAHAVGLDALASVNGILGALAGEGYGVCEVADLGKRLVGEGMDWPLEAYLAALEALLATS